MTSGLSKSIEELLVGSHGGVVRGGNVVICCPYHHENTPSLNVNIDETADVPVGTWNCFGCPESGAWNKLAAKLGSSLVSDPNERYVNGVQGYSGNTSTVKERNKQALKAQRKREKAQAIYVPGYGTPWADDRDWRTIKGSLIHSLGGQLYLDPRHSWKEPCLYLPVHVNDQHVGGVFCRITKKKGRRSYINSKGKWSKSSLYPYDWVVQLRRTMWNKGRALFLVEGWRDALNLVQRGIPALTVLGTAWSTEKLNLVLAYDPDLVVLMMDADSAGDRAVEKMYTSLTEANIQTLIIRLPNGRDPGELTSPGVKSLKRLVDRHLN